MKALQLAADRVTELIKQSTDYFFNLFIFSVVVFCLHVCLY